MLAAVIWDVDGVLAETEQFGHRVAFNRAFAALGLPWEWSDARYGELLATAGGLERLLADFATRDDVPRDDAARFELADRIHRLKNEHYATIVGSGALPLRAGVAELIEDCATAGVRMGIATTTSGANIEALLSMHLGRDWRRLFGSVIAAEQALRKKPDPLVYQLALRQLDVDPRQALAIEDSPAGIASALGAGLAVIVTRSRYFADAPVDGARAIGPSLGVRHGWHPSAAGGDDSSRVDLAALRDWHARG